MRYEIKIVNLKNKPITSRDIFFSESEKSTFYKTLINIIVEFFFNEYCNLCGISNAFSRIADAEFVNCLMQAADELYNNELDFYAAEAVSESGYTILLSRSEE